LSSIFSNFFHFFLIFFWEKYDILEEGVLPMEDIKKEFQKYFEISTTPL